MRVKICGVCRPEDASLAAAAGADYVGVILAPGRMRTQSVAEAGDIYAAAGRDVQRVGVFVDATPDEMARAAASLALDVIQLHGAETPEEVGVLRRLTQARIWKAVAVRSMEDVTGAASRYGDLVDGLLLDGAGGGGAGERFDWNAAASVRARVPAALQIIVAGGLDPSNVAHVIAVLAPDIVDVSSGVEEAPCRKSAGAVREFIAAARS